MLSVSKILIEDGGPAGTDQSAACFTMEGPFVFEGEMDHIEFAHELRALFSRFCFTPPHLYFEPCQPSRQEGACDENQIPLDLVTTVDLRYQDLGFFLDMLGARKLHLQSLASVPEQEDGDGGGWIDQGLEQLEALTKIFSQAMKIERIKAKGAGKNLDALLASGWRGSSGS